MISGSQLLHGLMAAAIILSVWFASLGWAGQSADPDLRPSSGFPPDLPLDAEGIPLRPLSDDELYRLLLAHSARNEAAMQLLATCHALGHPYGHPGWRQCILEQDRDPP